MIYSNPEVRCTIIKPFHFQCLEQTLPHPISKPLGFLLVHVLWQCVASGLLTVDHLQDQPSCHIPVCGTLEWYMITWYINTCGRLIIKLWMLADFAAVTISSFVTSLKLAPYRILSAIVASNNTGSWDTNPICLRSHWRFKFLMSILSNFCSQLQTN